LRDDARVHVLVFGVDQWRMSGLQPPKLSRR
jgi:hypothetical protein